MLRQRIITALLLAPLALVVILWVPHPVTMVALGLLVLAAAWEWAAFPGFVSPTARVAYVLAIAIAIAACWRMDLATSQWVIYAALGWWFLALVWIVFAPTRTNRWLAALAGFLVLIPTWLALVRLHKGNPQLVLFLVLLVVAADVGAYFSGRRFGRHKLAPRVSPGKTWEGALGGFAAAAAMTGFGAVWFKMDAVPFLAACALAAIASVVGDLAESLFKRHSGLKDSGSLLPGHGGLLDRVDSITAAAPAFLFSLECLGLLA